MSTKLTISSGKIKDLHGEKVKYRLYHEGFNNDGSVYLELNGPYWIEICQNVVTLRIPSEIIDIIVEKCKKTDK